MRTYVAFLRAINVAGHGSLKMNHLRAAFASAGGRRVRTYIQSGNVVFEAPAGGAAAIVRRAGARLRRELGDEPVIILRNIRDVEAAVGHAPFGGLSGRRGIKLYVAFLSRRPRSKPGFPLVSRAEALKAVGMENREVFVVSRRKKNGFFGFPNNFVEGQLGVPATTRNWSTVTRIVNFAGEA